MLISSDNGRSVCRSLGLLALLRLGRARVRASHQQAGGVPLAPTRDHCARSHIGGCAATTGCRAATQRWRTSRAVRARVACRCSGRIERRITSAARRSNGQCVLCQRSREATRGAEARGPGAQASAVVPSRPPRRKAPGAGLSRTGAEGCQGDREEDAAVDLAGVPPRHPARGHPVRLNPPAVGPFASTWSRAHAWTPASHPPH